MENQGRDPVGRSCPRGASYYQWRQGDTLSALARRAGVTPGAIQAANAGADFGALVPGEEICLPGAAITQTRAQLPEETEPVLAEAADPGQIPEIPLPPIVGTPDTQQPAYPGPSQDIGQIPVVPLPPIVGTPDTPQTGTPVVPLPPIVITPQQPVYPGITCPVGHAARTIRAGQTYADLLIDLNVSYNAMQSANPTLRPSRLTAGTPYCAPPAGARQSCSLGTHLYTMLPGETLRSLAVSLGTTSGRLLMLNPSLLPTDFTGGAVVCVP